MNYPFQVIEGSLSDQYDLQQSYISTGFTDRTQPRPLQANWKRIVSDLQMYGELCVTHSNTAASLSCRTDFETVLEEGKCSLIKGKGFLLACNQSCFFQATLEKGSTHACYNSLRFHDHSPKELLRIDLTNRSHIERFYGSLIKHWSKPDVPTPIPESTALRCLQKARQLLSNEAEDLQNYMFYDEDLCDETKRFDVRSVFPLLETLVDQYCLFHVRVGNDSIHIGYEHQFFDFEQKGNSVRLRSRDASFELDFNIISQARLLSASEIQDKQDVFLYDKHGQCVASLGMSSHASPRDKTLWRKMLGELCA